MKDILVNLTHSKNSGKKYSSAKSFTYYRLNKVGVSLSYTSALTKLFDIGVDHDATVNQWSQNLKMAEVQLNKEINDQLTCPMEISVIKKSEGLSIKFSNA